MKLYELTGEYLKVQEMLENEDFNKETIENTLDCIDFEIDVKAENYGKMIKNYETEMLGIKGQKEALKDALQDEIDRLDKKQKTIENKIKYLKESLGNAMKLTGKEKIKTDLFSFYFRKNQSTNIFDEKMALESDFVKIEKKVDKTALLKAMKAGRSFDFAEIKESESLIIR